MKTKTKYISILSFVIISLISSMILSFTPVSQSCSIDGGGCNKVHNCCYNYTFGIQNSHYGIGLFLILSTILLYQIKNPSNKKRGLIHLGVILGSIVAFWFLYLQQFVIRAYCKYCLVVDFSMIIALSITLFQWSDKNE